MNALLNNAPCAFLIFLGMAMAEPTLDKQAEPLPGAGEKSNLAFYEIFGNDNQEGVSDDTDSE